MLEKFSKLILGNIFSNANLREHRIAQYLLLSIGIVGFSVLFIAFLLLLSANQTPLASFAVVVALTYLLNFGLLRLTGSLSVTGIVFVLEQSIVIISLNYLYGGNRAEIYVWYPSIILIATFVLNKRWGLAIASAMAVATIHVEYLAWGGHPFPSHPFLGPTSNPWAMFISIPLALLVTALISWLFEDIRAVGEEQLRSSERRLRMHVEQTQLAVIETNNRSMITAWNPAAELIFGYRADEAIGRNVVDLIVLPADRPAIAQLLNELLHSRDVILNSNQNIAKDGRVVTCDWYNTPLVDESNNITGKAAMAVDVTKRKQYEEELRLAKEQAEESTRAKSEFLARMSHEIRTPMNGVIGLTSLLLETNLAPEQRDFAETIRKSSEALLNIINEILDFSKIESGKMALEAQPFNLHQCVEDALDLLAPQAAAKHLELAYLIETEVPPILIGDVTRLRQVLVNLIANAVKFTPTGEVYLHVEPKIIKPKTGEGQQIELLFTVQDTGIGIPHDKLPALFQSFSQIDDSTARRFGGTGLGLAISKHLCELMGGTMWVDSRIGQGSSFYFTVCAGIADKPEPERNEVDTTLATCRILIVDDNATSRRIVKQYVTCWQMLPFEANNGVEAIRLLQEGHQFDIALLNLTMPDTDGLALAQEIRQWRPPDQLPLILLTSITDGLRRQPEKLRAIAFLNKPLKPTKLYEILVNQLRQSPRVEQARPKPTMKQMDVAQKSPLTILLAEDNSINQKVALRILDRLGYRADAVANGLQAVEACRHQLYDVILMDMHMPEMDGIEATRRILQEYSGERPPCIIAMTAAAMPADKARCSEAGMQDFLAKPIQLNELVNILQRCQLRSPTALE